MFESVIEARKDDSTGDADNAKDPDSDISAGCGVSMKDERRQGKAKSQESRKKSPKRCRGKAETQESSLDKACYFLSDAVGGPGQMLRL